MKKISLKIKLTLKYTGCIFVATGIALFLATVISGTDAESLGRELAETLRKKGENR